MESEKEEQLSAIRNLISTGAPGAQTLRDSQGLLQGRHWTVGRSSKESCMADGTDPLSRQVERVRPQAEEAP
jgi:hypothetical protein